MSTKPDDGGPAFPAPEAGAQHFGDPSAYTGVSIRDWFAAHETLADYDHPESWKHYIEALMVFGGEPPELTEDAAVRRAYLQWEYAARAAMKLARADAMLAARKEAAQ